MCRKFQFNHTLKWYTHNPAPVLENDSHKLLWDFNIKTDHLISARRPVLMIINKRKRICKIVDFAVPADHRINLKESEKKDKYLDLARELKKAVEHESNDCADCDWCVRYRNYPNDSIFENGKNTERSPEDLRRLAVTQTSVKNYQLIWKTLSTKENLQNCWHCCSG